jgi:hypothetical protein
MDLDRALTWPRRLSRVAGWCTWLALALVVAVVKLELPEGASEAAGGLMFGCLGLYLTVERGLAPLLRGQMPVPLGMLGAMHRATTGQPSPEADGISVRLLGLFTGLFGLGLLVAAVAFIRLGLGRWLGI